MACRPQTLHRLFGTAHNNHVTQQMRFCFSFCSGSTMGRREGYGRRTASFGSGQDLRGHFLWRSPLNVTYIRWPIFFPTHRISNPYWVTWGFCRPISDPHGPIVPKRFVTLFLVYKYFVSYEVCGWRWPSIVGGGTARLNDFTLAVTLTTWRDNK